MQGPRVYLLYGVDPKQQKHNGENTKRQKNGESYKTAKATKQDLGLYGEDISPSYMLAHMP